MSKTLIQQTAIEKLKRKERERERERYFGFRNGEGFVAQAILDRVELKLHPLQCCVHRWQIRYACRRVHCNLQTTTSTLTSMDEDVDEKEKRERERERERDCCGQWRGLEARQCECWTKTSTTPETCLLLLSSPPYLSLSQIELNWIIVFDFSDSDLCYAIVTFYYFEILGNDSGGNIGYVSPNLFFKRRRLKCAHWPPTTAWVTNLYFFFFFLRNYKFCTLKKKKIEEKHYFGS